ncbi:MAG TPA: hypothetical protein VFB13_05235 [Reyranella sp.]|jgi:hypothetical protein|nr:hypothetical protein [Reyranella sp.]
MSNLEDDETLAQQKRKAAARARELATQLSRPEDQQRAIDLAGELDAQALALEDGAPSRLPNKDR